MIEQFQEVNPQIEAVLAAHEARSNSPIDPLKALAEAAKMPDSRDILEIGPVVRESYEQRLKVLEETGLDIRPVLAASYLVNLLTEDNLPHYTKTIDQVARHSEPLSAFLNRWTAEEDSHGVMLRDYGLMTGLIAAKKGAIVDYQQYQDGRVSQLIAGTEITIQSLAQGFAYTALQEDATNAAHRVEAGFFDPIGRRITNRIAGDESNHHRAYSSMAATMLDAFPDETVVAIRDQFHNFSMPGQIGIPGFKELATTIAVAGLFDEATIVRLQNKQLGPKYWNIENRQFSTDEAKIAQEELLIGDPKSEKRIRILEKIRDKSLANASRNPDSRKPFILGRTISTDELMQLAA